MTGARLPRRARTATGRRHRPRASRRPPAPTSTRSGRRSLRRASRPRRRSSASTRPTLPVRFGVRGPRLRPDRVPRAEGSAPQSTASRSSASPPRPTRSPTPGELGADPAACAVIVGTGVGGLEHARGAESTFHREGREPGQPVPRPDDDDERDRRARSRCSFGWTGPEPLHLHRVRGRRQRDRRGRRGSSATAAPTSSMAGGTEACDHADSRSPRSPAWAR